MTKSAFDAVDIDKFALDEEWLRQPVLFLHWAEKLADARLEHERCKNDQDYVAADLDRLIRKSPEEFGVSKITEGVVEKTVLLQKRYIEAQNATLEAKHRVDVFQARVSFLDHRKKALEGLVQLHLAGFYSEPRLPRGASEQAKDNVMRGKRDSAFGPSKSRG